MDRTSILETAEEHVSRNRNRSYGEPERNFANIAEKWSVTLQGAIARGYVLPHEVALCMVDLKTCRAIESPDNADNWVDGAGYFACGGEIATALTEEP